MSPRSEPEPPPSRLGDELVQLPTKADLDERFRDSDERWDERFRRSEQRWDERFRLSEQRSKDRFDALDERFRQSDKHIDERFKHLQRLIDQIDRTNWRLTLMVMGLWSATFGALMYAVFGA